MEKISIKSEQAFQYLSSIDRNSWTLLFANIPKFGHDTSNVAESFNQWIGSERKKSYLDILIGITAKIMTMFHERSNKYNLSDTMWCSKVNKILDNNFNDGQRYEVLPSTDSLFYIKGGRSGEFRVDTTNKTCSCLQFQQMQYPCIHAAAAISFSKQNIDNFVSDLYKSTKLIQLYAMTVEPILVSELESGNVLPPIVR